MREKKVPPAELLAAANKLQVVSVPVHVVTVGNKPTVVFGVRLPYPSGVPDGTRSDDGGVSLLRTSPSCEGRWHHWLRTPGVAALKLALRRNSEAAQKVAESTLKAAKAVETAKLSDRGFDCARAVSREAGQCYGLIGVQCDTPERAQQIAELLGKTLKASVVLAPATGGKTTVK